MKSSSDSAFDLSGIEDDLQNSYLGSTKKKKTTFSQIHVQSLGLYFLGHNIRIAQLSLCYPFYVNDMQLVIPIFTASFIHCTLQLAREFLPMQRIIPHDRLNPQSRLPKCVPFSLFCRTYCCQLVPALCVRLLPELTISALARVHAHPNGKEGRHPSRGADRPRIFRQGVSTNKDFPSVLEL
jgi:hypothetical protein